MTTVAHTPGPWEVSDEAVLSKNLNEYGNWIVVNCQRELTAQDRANLQLIAAAPDLLHAVQVAREVFNSRLDEEHCLADRPLDWSDLKRAMDAAITKAKGGAA